MFDEIQHVVFLMLENRSFDNAVSYAYRGPGDDGYRGAAIGGFIGAAAGIVLMVVQSRRRRRQEAAVIGDED